MAKHCEPNRGDRSDSSSEDEFYDTLSELSRNGESRGDIPGGVPGGTADPERYGLGPTRLSTGQHVKHKGFEGTSLDSKRANISGNTEYGMGDVNPARPHGDHTESEANKDSTKLKDGVSEVVQPEQKDVSGSVRDAETNAVDEGRPTVDTEGKEQPAEYRLPSDTFHEGLAAEAEELEGSGGESGGLGGPGVGTEEVDGGGEDEDGEGALRQLEDQLTEEEKQERKDRAQILKKEGNDLYKSEEYLDAIHQYTEAIMLCPLSFKKERSIMYANRAACKVYLEQLEEAVKDCTKALDLHQHYMKVLLRRAHTYELLEKLDEALADYQRALELDPGCHTARAACMRLPEQINERNEKLKAEMMEKLKGLGNMVLRPFGLSTDNFQMQQDPNSGSYSVNFVQGNKTNGN